MSLLRTVWHSSFGDDTFLNTPAYNSSGTVDEINAADALDDIVDHWVSIFNQLTGLQINGFVWDLVKLLAITFPTGEENEIGEVGLGIPGLGVGNPLPNFVSALIQIGVTGNARAARFFVPSLSEVDSATNDWDVPTVIVLQNAGNLWASSFVGPLTGQTFIPGMWSTTEGAFFSANGAVIVNASISHQVKRRAGRGQ